MPSAERTAYPQFSPTVTTSELEQSFTPTEGELEFAQSSTRTNQHAFCFLALLKCFQRLHYFPSMKEIPAIIVDHLRSFLHLRPELPLATPRCLSTTTRPATSAICSPAPMAATPHHPYR